MFITPANDMCGESAISSSSAFSQKRSSSGFGPLPPFGELRSCTDLKPIASARSSSAIASSIPEIGISALPMSRSGAIEQ